MEFKIEEKLKKLLPEMTAEEYIALKEDIETNGQLSPVIVNQDGVILDGHHRRQILNELGISDDQIRKEVKQTQNFEEMKSICYGAQQGRNLYPFQRCELVYNLLWKDIQRRAEERELAGENPQTNPSEGMESGEASEIAARKASVGQTTWKNARKIMDSDYEKMKEGLRKGKFAIHAVYEYLITLDKIPEEKREPFKAELMEGKMELNIKGIYASVEEAEGCLDDYNELVQSTVKPTYEDEFYTENFGMKKLKQMCHDLIVASGGNPKLKTAFWEIGKDVATEEEAKEKAKKLGGRFVQSLTKKFAEVEVDPLKE